MNEVMVLLIGVAAGTYFAEPIRGVVPVLKPKEK